MKAIIFWKSELNGYICLIDGGLKRNWELFCKLEEAQEYAKSFSIPITVLN